MYLTNSQVSLKNFDNFIYLEVAISRVRVYDAPPGILCATVRETSISRTKNRPRNPISQLLLLTTAVKVNVILIFDTNQSFHVRLPFRFFGNEIRNPRFYNIYWRGTGN
jgi:hypothetical protein